MPCEHYQLAKCGQIRSDKMVGFHALHDSRRYAIIFCLPGVARYAPPHSRRGRAVHRAAAGGGGASEAVSFELQV